MRMRKTVRVLMYLLFAATAIYPVGAAVAACFGYDFAPTSVPTFALTTAALSVCVTVLGLVSGSAAEGKALPILSALITPLSLICAVLCVLKCPQVTVIASTALLILCCCSLTAKHTSPLRLKTAVLLLSALMLLPISAFGLGALLFGNAPQSTVVRTLPSPDGRYRAEVIESNQGALGGDSFVDVYENGEIHLLLFKIEKKPQRVWSGGWSESEDMLICWKDDDSLLINSTLYEIK